MDLKERKKERNTSRSLLSFDYPLPAVCHKQTGSSRNDNKQTDPSFTRSDATHPPPSNVCKATKKISWLRYINSVSTSSTNLRSYVFIFMTLASEKCLSISPVLQIQNGVNNNKIAHDIITNIRPPLYGRPFEFKVNKK